MDEKLTVGHAASHAPNWMKPEREKMVKVKIMKPQALGPTPILHHNHERDHLKNKVFSELTACRACSISSGDALDAIMIYIDDYARAVERKATDDVIEQSR